MILAYLPQCATNARHLQVVDFSHACQSMAFEKVQKRKAHGVCFHRLDDGRASIETCQPITESLIGNLQIHGDLGKTVGRLLIELVIPRGHDSNTILCLDTEYTTTMWRQ